MNKMGTAASLQTCSCYDQLKGMLFIGAAKIFHYLGLSAESLNSNNGNIMLEC